MHCPPPKKKNIFPAFYGRGHVSYAYMGHIWVMCPVSLDARLDVNVALNRPAYQSSTHTGGYGTLHARFANDGDRSTDLSSLSCTHTQLDVNPWWAVDLTLALYVLGVKFTNRNDAGMALFVLCICNHHHHHPH